MRHRTIEIIRDWRKGPVPSPAANRRRARQEERVLQRLCQGLATHDELRAILRGQPVRPVLTRLYLRGYPTHYHVGPAGQGFALTTCGPDGE